jgi:UDP-glucose 4-epimerase
LVKGDIQAPELTDTIAGAHPHVIFHLAAHVDLDTSVSDPQFDARSNVLCTINLCEAARQAGVRRIVYAASGDSRYGAGARLPVDESNPLDPPSPNAVAKLAGEMYQRAYAEMYGLAPICLALANVYGLRQHPHGAAGVIAVLGSAMITGRPSGYIGTALTPMTMSMSMTSSTPLCAPVASPSKRPAHTTSAPDSTQLSRRCTV